MVRSDDVRHGLIGVVSTRQFETLADDRLGMITPMSAIERIILRQN